MQNSEETIKKFKPAIKQYAFLNWLVPLLIILSPILVSFFTALPNALRVSVTPNRGPLQLIAFVVSSFTLFLSVFLLGVTATPFFLYNIPKVRVKLKKRVVIILAVSFSILSAMTLWWSLAWTNMISLMDSIAYWGGLAQVKTQDWVYFVIAGGIVLIILNLIVLVGQEITD